MPAKHAVQKQQRLGFLKAGQPQEQAVAVPTKMSQPQQIVEEIFVNMPPPEVQADALENELLPALRMPKQLLPDLGSRPEWQ